jgi:hypothetical protein
MRMFRNHLVPYSNFYHDCIYNYKHHELHHPHPPCLPAHRPTLLTSPTIHPPISPTLPNLPPTFSAQSNPSPAPRTYASPEPSQSHSHPPHTSSHHLSRHSSPYATHECTSKYGCSNTRLRKHSSGASCTTEPANCNRLMWIYCLVW